MKAHPKEKQEGRKEGRKEGRARKRNWEEDR